MRKMMVISAVAALVGFGAVQPAEATGTASRLGTSVTVYGSGLHVDSVTARRHGHRIRSAARLFVVRGGREVRSVRAWREASASNGTDVVSWRVGQNFRSGDRLCTEWRSWGTPRHPGWACVLVHR